MDKTVGFLDPLPPEGLKLTLNQQPFFQRQHSDYWSIEGMKINDYDLFICTGGRAGSLREGSPLLEEGKAFLARPGVPIYARHRGDDFFTAAAQHFDLKIFGEIDFFTLINYRPLIGFTDWPYARSVLDRYRSLFSGQRMKMQQHTLFHTILTEFIYDAFLSENSDQHESYNFIFQMLSFIQDHFTDADVLEKALLLSPYSHDYTSRVFKKRVGIPPKQYILKSRLNLGRNLLLQDLPVKEIAWRCGFSDELYFSRLFRNHMDISPRAFRKQHIGA